MPHQVRLPDDLYEALRQIKHPLDLEYYSAAPSLQDMVTVAVKRFIADSQDTTQRSLLVEELLEQRKIARSKMGRRKKI